MKSPEQLIEQAQAKTGLSDFGGDSWREGLDVLVRSLNEEAQLNAAGDAYLSHQLQSILEQRLQVEDWYRRHPEIDDEVIHDPLIGVSLPRTGSSALSFLLSCDPDIRYLRVWEAGAPCPPPNTVEGPDPRRGSEDTQPAGSRSHTPTGIDGATECQLPMAFEFRSQIYQAFARIPTYSEWFEAADLTSTYAYEKRILKLLQWGAPAKPWRLKNPTHLLFMPYLQSVFPDARYVMTHRDPTDVILSVCTVYADIMGQFTDTVDLDYIGQLNVASWKKGIARAMAFRADGNDDRFFDIHFKAMHKDPVGEIRRLYDWLGEDVSPDFEANMQSWWQQNEEREPNQKLTAEQLNIDIDAVREHFADYRTKMAEWTQTPVS